MGFLLPPTGFAERPQQSPYERVQQLDTLHKAGVITSGQLLDLLKAKPDCPHGVDPDDCEHLDCVVDYVGNL